MRELRTTTIDGKVYLFPEPVVAERKYLIFCSSKEEASKVTSAVRLKKVPHPDLVSEHFIFLTFHTDKKTKIFIFNSQAFAVDLT